MGKLIDPQTLADQAYVNGPGNDLWPDSAHRQVWRAFAYPQMIPKAFSEEELAVCIQCGL